ncbi:MAG: hypothetical protein M5U28_50240 [Sandaracinaceae bacterium]|nr:hypothetical protein [Sandaracinaceae bacterium]
MESYEIWNALLERTTAAGLESLTPVERAVVRVNCFVYAVDNGGLSGFLYNIEGGGSEPTWSELRAVAEAVRQVGALECAGALVDLAVLVEGSAARAPPTWEALLESLGTAFERLEQRIEAYVPQLWDQLEAYTQQHLGVGRH